MRHCSASGRGRRSSPARGEPRRARLRGMPRAGQLWPASMPAPAPATDTSGLGPGAAQLVAAAQAAAQSFEAAQVAYAQEQRTILTLQALNSLGRILGGLPGRKNIIWVTGNLPFSLIPENRNMTNAELEESLPSQKIRSVDQHSAGNYAATFRQAHADEIRETAARLASAQVAVYPVDARGLSISTSIDSQETMRETSIRTKSSMVWSARLKMKQPLTRWDTILKTRSG